MTTRVLVTGASGLIGRQAIRHAGALGETHLLVRKPLPDDVFDQAVASPYVIHYVDLLDATATARCVKQIQPTHLLHLAWHGDGGDRWTSAANVDWTAATVSLVRCFAASGGHRIVMAGSCAEYDWNAERFVEDETPLQPRSRYGLAKATTHQCVMAVATQLGLSAAWAHVFFCYGPGEPAGRLVSDVISGVLNGRRIPCTPGTQIRDYMHTADIGRALVMLLSSSFAGSINIASGVGVSVRDVALCAADLLGRRDLLDFGAKPVGPGEPQRIVANVDRMRNALNFVPAFTLEQGMADTVQWFQTHLTRGQ